MIAKNFLAYHKKAGQSTEFEAKIKAKDKQYLENKNILFFGVKKQNKKGFLNASSFLR